MKKVRDIAVFRSGRFTPLLPDGCQVKPRSYGAELAFWLTGKLALQGVVTSYPVAAENGWALASGSSLLVLCANVGGSDAHWRLSLAQDEEARTEEARALVKAIRFVLHAAVPVQDIDWRYDKAP